MTSPRATRRHVERRRRQFTVGIGAAVILVVVGLIIGGIALFGGGGTDEPSSHAAATAASSSTSTTATTAPARTTASAPTTVPAPSTPTAAPPSTTVALSAIDTGRTYAVGTRTLTFVDTSRPTSPNGDFAGAPSRTLPTEFWYPATGSSGDAPVADATPDRQHGPYPLVLFAHGYNVTPDFYAPLLERWAAAGYVVAAPVFPILSGSDGGASHVDYEQTWTDASFVITQVLKLGGTELLTGLVDPNRIAVAGHSDGEVISFGLGFLQCCRDLRVRSVISMAGDLSNANNPSVRDTGTPILHIMETNDEFDPYPDSIQWDRDNLDSPRWMLSLLGASHVPPYTQPGNPAFELVSTATIAFFDGTLKGHPEQLDALANAVANSNGVGALER
jgi:dienelactone hydrolase